MTHGQLLDTMSSAELAEWMALAKLEGAEDSERAVRGDLEQGALQALDKRRGSRGRSRRR